MILYFQSSSGLFFSKNFILGIKMSPRVIFPVESHFPIIEFAYRCSARLNELAKGGYKHHLSNRWIVLETAIIDEANEQITVALNQEEQICILRGAIGNSLTFPSKTEVIACFVNHGYKDEIPKVIQDDFKIKIASALARILFY